MQTFQTEIADAAGKLHRYTCTPFNYREGLALKLELLEILSAVLGRGLGSVHSLADLDFDMAGLGEALSRLPAGIMQHGGPELARRLLSGCHREAPFGDTGTTVSENLGEAAVLDRVYAANYVESYLAIAWVVEVNYGPFSGETTGQWSGLLARLKTYLLESGIVKSLSEPSAPAPTPKPE